MVVWKGVDEDKEKHNWKFERKLTTRRRKIIVIISYHFIVKNPLNSKIAGNSQCWGLQKQKTKGRVRWGVSRWAPPHPKPSKAQTKKTKKIKPAPKKTERKESDDVRWPPHLNLNLPKPNPKKNKKTKRKSGCCRKTLFALPLRWAKSRDSYRRIASKSYRRGSNR